MILDRLTEEDAYLFTILTDPSGVDQAEFAWSDPEQPDGCFRAWPYQVAWWRDESSFQVDLSARSVGKSTSIVVRLFAFPFVYPGQEAVVTAPTLNHLTPVTDLIERRMRESRLAREMLPRKANHGFTHRPFAVTFKNGARIMGRIPQLDGTGVKGMHPLILEQDEGQDYPAAGFTELIETVKQGSEGFCWRVHGVTNGARDQFYKISRPDSGWTVHHITAIHRPTWSDAERKNKIESYGSRNSPDYRRNIFGEPSASENPMLVARRLLKCVDMNASSEYNQDVFQSVRIRAEQLEDAGGVIADMIPVPALHKKKWKTFWLGADVGFCVDEETRIFTRRGWKSVHELEEGDETLAIDPETSESNWERIEGVHIFPAPPEGREMVRMQGQTFDAFTTPNHRWLTRGEPSGYRRERGLEADWRWRTTETLCTKDRIPLSVQRGDAPTRKIHPDAFVELVAWYYTEGHLQEGGGVQIGQSFTANPDKCKRIEACVTELFGEPGPLDYGPHIPEETYRRVLEMVAQGYSSYKIAKEAGVSRWAVDNWKAGHVRRYFRWSKSDWRIHKHGMQYANIPPQETGALRRAAPGKVPSMEFLLSLTQDQLELFIDVSVLGDGWQQHGPKFEQHEETRADAYVSACLLAGRPVSIFADTKRHRWAVNQLTSAYTAPKSPRKLVEGGNGMKIERESYDGAVWCPSVKHQNWLARRGGSVYFTGNTIDPSEILVFGEATPKGTQESVLTLLMRVTLERIRHTDQAEAMAHLIMKYNPQALALDKTGVGLPLFQDLQDRFPSLAARIRGYNFSEKLIVDLDHTIEVDPDLDDEIEKTKIVKVVLEHSSDVIRDLVDAYRIMLPNDDDVLNSFRGETYSNERLKSTDLYGRRKFRNTNKSHILDAARMAAMAWSQAKIESMLEDRKEPDEIVLPQWA